MNSFSRSNTSISLRVTSPWTSSGMPTSAMASSTGKILSTLVTPESELVVAPAGYSLAACTKPVAFAARISSGWVRSVRYSTINGSKWLPVGRAARMRSR
ncbi:hypothetical protein D3C77_625240 [compost metagenome]